MNLDLELATLPQIADELKKRQKPFILIVGQPPNGNWSAEPNMDMATFMNVPPPAAADILEQLAEIMKEH